MSLSFWRYQSEGRLLWPQSAFNLPDLSRQIKHVLSCVIAMKMALAIAHKHTHTPNQGKKCHRLKAKTSPLLLRGFATNVNIEQSPETWATDIMDLCTFFFVTFSLNVCLRFFFLVLCVFCFGHECVVCYGEWEITC